MIDDFRPLMTNHKVTTIQGYFLVLGAAEGQLRTEVLPAATGARSSGSGGTSAGLPAARAFSRAWPTMSKDMAPMIGTMADNVANYRAVDALPPFWLFPWFFVLPGLAIIALSLFAVEPARPSAAPVTAQTTDAAASHRPAAERSIS